MRGFMIQEMILKEISEDLKEIKTLLTELVEMNKKKVKSEEEKIEGLEEYRDSIFNTYKESLAYQVQHKSTDWEKLRKLFNIKTIAQTRIYIESRLEEEGLI
jgi:hypothetical protein